MAYYEGPVIDGPLAGTTMGQWGATHEVVINTSDGPAVILYQFRDGDWYGAWYERTIAWDEANDTWALARTPERT